MNSNYIRYNENFEEDIDVQHKIGEKTEKNNYHLHKQFEVVYTLSDNLIYCTENKIIPIPKDSILLLNSMSLHHIDYRRDAGPCDRYVLIFSPESIMDMLTPEVNILECFLNNQGAEGTILTAPDEMLEEFHAILESMTNINKRTKKQNEESDTWERDMNRLFLKFQLGQFMILVNKLYHREYKVSQTRSYRTHLTQTMEICRFLDLHYAEDINVDELAKRFLMSKTQMYYIFKETMQMTVTDYLTQIRMMKAKDLLINTAYSVEMISQKVGYGSISSFSRVFKSKTKMNPLAYRKRLETFH